METGPIVEFMKAAVVVGFLAKLLVDGVKIAVDLPRAAPIVLAFAAAFVFQALLMLNARTVFDGATVAGGAITGFIGWALAIGITMAQTKADKVEQKVQTALDSPAGTTRAELDKVVEKQA